MNSKQEYEEENDKRMNLIGQNGPSGLHYLTDDEYNFDVIDICKAYSLNFNRGNVVKYICRADKKDNELEDLKKALNYIKREIEYKLNK